MFSVCLVAEGCILVYYLKRTNTIWKRKLSVCLVAERRRIGVMFYKSVSNSVDRETNMIRKTKFSKCLEVEDCGLVYFLAMVCGAGWDGKLHLATWVFFVVIILNYKHFKGEKSRAGASLLNSNYLRAKL